MRLLSGIIMIWAITVCCQTEKMDVAGKLTKASVSVLKFDPGRHAEQDIEKAVQFTRQTGDYILLDVGGEWCIWCHRLDSVLYQTEPIMDFLEQNYVVVKVNYSKENKNTAVLDSLPEIPGYPHLFVLDENGKLLHSQGSEALEEGKKHSPEKVMNFLRNWAPKKGKNG